MAALIVVISTGFLVYWAFRSWLLALGEQWEIEEVLEADCWLWRRLLVVLRGVVLPGV